MPVSKNYEDISKISLEVSNGEKIFEQQQKSFYEAGKLTPAQVVKIITDISKVAEIVGLII